MITEEKKVILLLSVVCMLYITVAAALFFFALYQLVIIDPSEMNNASIGQILSKFIFPLILALIANYIIIPLIESWETRKDIKKIGGEP